MIGLLILLGLLVVVIVTIRGLYVRERTSVSTIAAMLATAILVAGIVRLYHGGAKADEEGTSGDIDLLTAVMVLGSTAALTALAARLSYIKRRALN